MLNISFLSSKNFKKAYAIALFSFVLINLGCGKRKPPLPPVEKVVQRVEISGVQRGKFVTLAWRLPAQNAPTSSPLNINRVDIYRLTENPNVSLVLSEEEFASRSVLIKTLPITEEDFRRQQVLFDDQLELGGQNLRIRYAIRFVNSSGQKAAFSNFLLIEPTTKIADSPTSVTSEISEFAVKIKWNAPAQNIDGSVPPNILGFNVYRFDEGNTAAKLINKNPISDSEYSDQSFEFGKNYKYFVRAVSLGNGGESVESLDSNVIEVQPRDVFPPASPSALTVAAAPNNLSLFFASNAEKDLAGYRIYRSTDRKTPTSDWELLTRELLTTNTYQDKNVSAGATYFYYIVAVDQVGNISLPSEIVSETAP